ncbi:E3 ubiquitin-protein ligase TTC3-like isoform X3 [Acropora muricata]|uniref:E3 ubiquitin-protein ligase TTC3-like isoform X3 n=1 Tax=Acropora muricata TaxID=159855 RepID=UPI0034E503DB
MPNAPRKNLRNKEASPWRREYDADEDDLPPLVPCNEEEDSDTDSYYEKSTTKMKTKPFKTKNNAECADMWYELSSKEKEENIHVMKIYLLSPFLFGQVKSNQDDKWINWAYDCDLLPSKSTFEIKPLEEKYFDAIDVIEDAFDKLADNALRKNKDGLVKTLDIIANPKLRVSQHLDKAILCAESFLAFTNIRGKIEKKQGMTKEQGDMALLLAHNQVSCHVKDLASGVDIVASFNKECKQGEKQTADKKKEGNAAFQEKKYKAAISRYTLALHSSPYNHILYSNRAQSYLKAQEPWCAVADSRRAVVLKGDWDKAHLRYAQAFFEIGQFKRAKEVNRKGRKICAVKKELDSQFVRFEKRGNLEGNIAGDKKFAKERKLPHDLPGWVTPNPSDTGGSEDDDEDEIQDELEDQTASEDLNSDSSDDESGGSSEWKKPNSATEWRKERRGKKLESWREKLLDQAKPEVLPTAEKRKNKRAKALQLEQKKRDLTGFLKQGSSAILKEKYTDAVQNYSEAMSLLKQQDFKFQVFDMVQTEFVTLSYGLGAAYLKLGGHDELLKAKRQFEIILDEHKNFIFPLAYLGIGRVFWKQNRFLEALQPLEKGLAVVVNKGSKDLKTYRWPQSSCPIDESKYEKLKSEIETLIRKCRHPPPPDAVCRYPDCLNKLQIYQTDPDYKGYVRLVCNDECKVDFHPACWKKQKTTRQEQAGDKDFLEDPCFTPDCGGRVVNIQLFDTEGLKIEFKHERLHAKPEPKPKAAKQNKVKAGGINLKQKKKKGKEDLKIKDSPTEDFPPDVEGVSIKPTLQSNLPTPEEMVSKQAHSKLEKEDYDTSDGFQTGEGVFILKKEDENEQVKGVGKAKTKKKKLKNTQTLDEFLQDRGGQQTLRPGLLENDDVDEVTLPKSKFNFVPPPPCWSQHEMEGPFAMDTEIQRMSAKMEAARNLWLGSGNLFPQHSSTGPQQPDVGLDEVVDYVTSMIEEILRVHGPLELADPNIMQPLSSLPDSYQNIIESAGGLRAILEKSYKFVFYQNEVMLQELLLENMKKLAENPFLHFPNGMNNTGELSMLDEKLVRKVEQWVNRDDNVEASRSQSKSSSTKFNPDAKEFVPAPSQTDLLRNSSPVTPVVTLQETELRNEESRKESTITKDLEPVSSECKVKKSVENTIENVVTDVAAKNVKGGDNVDCGEGTIFKEGGLEKDVDLSKTACNFAPAKETVTNVEGTTLPLTCHKGKGSNITAIEPAVVGKEKSVQTQQSLKSKCVGTEPLLEPFKAEYQRVAAERDACQTSLKKTLAEVDKVKKELSEVLQEKEKYYKELQELKQKNLEEMHKLRQECEDKDDRLKILSKNLQQNNEDKSGTINNLKQELATIKGQFTLEKDAWNKERSEKENLVKNIKIQHQQQQGRAQEAEIKLLELRRDVGLRFLERAYQESHVTINNLIKAANARVAGPKVEDLIATWKTYTVECHQRIVQCKANFNDQIELLKNGRTLASVPHLTIPGPPPYPGIPVLQSLLPGQQQQQNQGPPQAQSLVNGNAPALRAAHLPLPSTSTSATPTRPVNVAPPTAIVGAANGDKLTDAAGRAMAAAVAAAPLHAAVGGIMADKAKSNSFEKIMLRLSTMYPNFSRLELTGFIKEVRQNKHGSLTGLSLEDIVANVSALVEQKKKAGLLRPAAPPTTNISTIQRPTNVAAMPQVTQPSPILVPPSKIKPTVQEVSDIPTNGGSEEDMCVICHEDMNLTSIVVTLECGHRYHSHCIRKWLLGEQSTCPTCRVHALLPDEFPRLK